MVCSVLYCGQRTLCAHAFQYFKRLVVVLGVLLVVVAQRLHIKRLCLDVVRIRRFKLSHGHATFTFGRCGQALGKVKLCPRHGVHPCLIFVLHNGRKMVVVCLVGVIVANAGVSTQRSNKLFYHAISCQVFKRSAPRILVGAVCRFPGIEVALGVVYLIDGFLSSCSQ